MVRARTLRLLIADLDVGVRLAFEDVETVNDSLRTSAEKSGHVVRGEIAVTGEEFKDIDVGIGDARWPTFNVADMAVSVGAFLLAWVLWGEDNPPQRETEVAVASEGEAA